MTVRPRPNSEFFGDDERSEINRIGAVSGCHSCGVKQPGTKSGNWIADVQPPSALNWSGKEQRLYPHCLRCKKMQGLAIRDMLRKNAQCNELRVVPPNSVVFIADATGGKTPDLDCPGNVWWTESCVVVGCASIMDGKVKLTFTSNIAKARVFPPIFDGIIETPGKILTVMTSENEILLQSDVPNAKTRIQIWMNDPIEADEIDILFHEHFSNLE